MGARHSLRIGKVSGRAPEELDRLEGFRPACVQIRRADAGHEVTRLLVTRTMPSPEAPGARQSGRSLLAGQRLPVSAIDAESAGFEVLVVLNRERERDHQSARADFEQGATIRLAAASAR
jgi:hypothetical protein